jgi:hypothetical protein
MPGSAEGDLADLDLIMGDDPAQDHDGPPAG